MNKNFEKFSNNYDKYHKMVKIKIRRSKSKQIKTISNQMKSQRIDQLKNLRKIGQN